MALRADARFTMAAGQLLGLLEHARRRGLKTDGVLSAAGLAPEALQGPEARVPHAAFNEVWSLVAEQSGDADFGLHWAEQIDVRDFHVVGHLAARSRTLGEALDRIVAFSRILHDAGRFEVERAGDALRVYPGCRGLPHEQPRHVAEFNAASVLTLARLVTGSAITARAVALRHAAPAHAAEHVRIFGVAPRFGQPETLVELDAAVTALPIREADPALTTLLDAYARELLARLPEDDDLPTRVAREITVHLARGVPDVAVIARRLGVGARTLQRRLAEAGTSFQAAVDAARRAMAERTLADPHLSIAEAAFLSGFSEPASFHRAFRRWTGTTPSRWRARADARSGGASHRR